MELITGTPLHEITGAFCNQDQRLQAVITGEICNQALQDGPVITCNRDSVIAPLDMSPDTDRPPCERVKGDYVSYVLNPATAIDQQSDVDEPDPRCPVCGSDFGVMLTLRPDHWSEVECWNCGATWGEGEER